MRIKFLESEKRDKGRIRVGEDEMLALKSEDPI
jgi:hypothetical protein